MINSFLRSTFFSLLALFSLSSLGQDFKPGYTNVDYILAYMPEAAEAQEKLEDYEAELIRNLQNKQKVINEKYVVYNDNQDTWSELQLESLAAEVRGLEAEYREAANKMSSLMEQKQVELLAPLYNKIQNAINTVCETYGYTHVWNSESLLYASQGDDISNLVFQALGVTPPQN